MFQRRPNGTLPEGYRAHPAAGAGPWFVAVPGHVPPERGALAWAYDRFLAAADAAAGTPCDTASLYPQYAVSAFVRWPLGPATHDPNAVLPRAYRDSQAGFFGWRDRWRDADDTVITVLTNPVRGYMGAPADTALAVHSRGRRLAWGRVTEGPVRHWWSSPRGEVSTLTLADGTAFAVDFSGASGADVMLVTSGPAEGQTVRVPGGAITCWFPTADRPPVVRAEGDAAVVGGQRILLRDSHLTLTVAGR